MVKTFFYGSDWRSQIVLEKIRKSRDIELINDWKKADLGLVASYGKILTQQEIEHFKQGVLNVHPSLLPKYRGGKQVAATILNGEEVTGVSIIKLVEKVDAGPIVAQIKAKILPGETTAELEKRLFELGGKLLGTILAKYLAGKIKVRAQNEDLASWAPKLTKQDGEIDWCQKPRGLERFIRAMNPCPGAWINLKLKVKNQKEVVKRLKILKAHLKKDKLILDEVQLEGKKPVAFRQFLAGYPQLQPFWQSKQLI